MRESISIIILNHNNEYIVDVVKNCIYQLFDNDEIIIINDDTNNIKEIDNLKNDYNQIVSINVDKKNNRGHNRNIGFKAAKNEIVLFIDGDILIDKNSLYLISKDFCNNDVVAVTGFTHLMSYTAEQLTLLGFTPKYSFLEQFNTKILADFPELIDYRANYSDDKLNSKYNWIYFFSSFFAIHKLRVPQNLSFIESLDGWGAEDIEFAYQISLNGRMIFNRDINNMHIPHKRDHVKNLITNHKNLYQLLKKHPLLEFEVLLNFNSPGDTISKIYKMIDSIHYENDYILPSTVNSSYLYTTIYSRHKTNIVVCDNAQHCYSLLGIALPLSTQAIDNAYIDMMILKYPMCIVSLILREHIRVAKNVYMIGEYDGNRFIDNGYFKNHILDYVDYHIVHDLRMFQFTLCDKGWEIQSSLPKYELFFSN